MWLLQRVYAGRIEAECPLRDVDDEDQDEVYTQREGGVGAPPAERCYLCDEERGAEHGYIYLGEGWVEAVYRLETVDDGDNEPDEAP